MKNQSFEEKNDSLNQIIQSIGNREHEQARIYAWNHIETLMQALDRYPEDDLFIWTDLGNGVKQVTPTLLAKAVISILANCMGEILSYYPAYTFNPYIDIFVIHAMEGDLVEKVLRHATILHRNGVFQNEVEHEIFVDMAMAVDSFIVHLRYEMRSKGFKHLIAKAKRACNENFKGLKDYINALFDDYWC